MSFEKKNEIIKNKIKQLKIKWQKDEVPHDVINLIRGFEFLLPFLVESTADYHSQLIEILDAT